MKKINPILILSGLGVVGALYYFLIYKKEDKSEGTSEETSQETKEKPKAVVPQKSVYARADKTNVWNFSTSTKDNKKIILGSRHIVAKKGQLLGKGNAKVLINEKIYLLLKSVIDNKPILVYENLATIK
jgi:hypothetical protein